MRIFSFVAAISLSFSLVGCSVSNRIDPDSPYIDMGRAQVYSVDSAFGADQPGPAGANGVYRSGPRFNVHPSMRRKTQISDDELPMRFW